MSFYNNNKEGAKWVKSEEINGLIYHVSEKGAVKITDPSGKVLCMMSGQAAAIIGDHTEGLSSFTNNIVKPYLDQVQQKKQDEKLAYRAQKEAEKLAAQLELIARVNPDLLQAVLNKKQSA